MKQQLPLLQFLFVFLFSLHSTAHTDPKKLERLFFESAQKGNLNELEKCLQDGVKIDAIDEQDNTALHYAAENGHIEIIERLFQGQKDPGYFLDGTIWIDIDAKNKDGNTPLQKATENGHENVVKRLLEGYVDNGFIFSSKIKATINTHNNRQNTPVHAAASIGNTMMLHLFLTGHMHEGILQNSPDQGNIHARNIAGEEPVHMIANHTNPEILQLLINHGANIEAEDNKGKKLLERAAQSGNIALVDALVNKFGAHYMTEDGKKSSALHIAFEINNITLATIFALNKKLLNSRDEKGLTPLAIAVNKQEIPLIQFALTNGADVTIKDFQQTTVLHTAAQKNNLSITELLLKSGKFDHSLINAQDHLGKTAFRYAAEHSNIQMMDALLHYKACFDCKDNNGNTELHHAASTDNFTVCQYLLSCNADPKIRNKAGKNTFDIIVDNNNDTNNLLSLITSHKSFNINTPDAQGKNALIRAIEANDLSKVRKHIELGADVCFSDAGGNTTLHKAIPHGNRKIVNELIKANPTVLSQLNNHWQTPLLIALANKQETIAYDLLSAGAEKYFLDARGYSPLDYALEYDLLDIAQEFVIPEIITYINENKKWTFHRALKKHAHTVVKQMINANINIHMTDDDGDTPLLTAARYNNEIDAKLLIQCGANQNFFNNTSNRTPLMYAAINNNINFAAMLLANKATIDIKDNNNFTALTHATKHANLDMMEFLMQRGSSIETRDVHGNSLLHIAAQVGDNRSLLLLASIGLSSQSKNKQDETPLDTAIRANKVSSVEFFIDRMPPLSIQSLDSLIAKAKWHSSGNVLIYISNIKTKNVGECEQITQAQVQLQTTAHANEKRAAAIKKEKGSYSSSYRKANYAATYTLDYLMTKTSSERKSLLHTIKEQLAHETKEQIRLETQLQKIQFEHEQAQKDHVHIINEQHTIYALKQDNEQLFKQIEEIAQKLPKQTVETYKPSAPLAELNVDIFTQMNSQNRQSILETLLASKKHEQSENARLTELLHMLQSDKQKTQAEHEECPACQKTYSHDHFVKIEENDGRRMPCKQCLRKHTKADSAYVPHICKTCFQKSKTNDHNTCSYCKKNR